MLQKHTLACQMKCEKSLYTQLIRLYAFWNCSCSWDFSQRILFAAKIYCGFNPVISNMRRSENVFFHHFHPSAPRWSNQAIIGQSRFPFASISNPPRLLRLSVGTYPAISDAYCASLGSFHLLYGRFACDPLWIQLSNDRRLHASLWWKHQHHTKSCRNRV